MKQIATGLAYDAASLAPIPAHLSIAALKTDEGAWTVSRVVRPDTADVGACYNAVHPSQPRPSWQFRSQVASYCKRHETFGDRL